MAVTLPIPARRRTTTVIFVLASIPRILPQSIPKETDHYPSVCLPVAASLRPFKCRSSSALKREFAISARHLGSRSGMTALSSNLRFRVAAVALTFRNFSFSFSPLVGRERSTDIYSLAEAAIRLSAHIAFIPWMRLNQFPFTF
jgi:hypothetical protein